MEFEKKIFYYLDNKNPYISEEFVKYILEVNPKQYQILRLGDLLRLHNGLCLSIDTGLRCMRASFEGIPKDRRRKLTPSNFLKLIEHINDIST